MLRTPSYPQDECLKLDTRLSRLFHNMSVVVVVVSWLCHCRSCIYVCWRQASWLSSRLLFAIPERSLCTCGGIAFWMWCEALSSRRQVSEIRGSSRKYGRDPFHQGSYYQIVSKWRILDIDPDDFRCRFQLCPPRSWIRAQGRRHSHISDKVQEILRITISCNHVL